MKTNSVDGLIENIMFPGEGEDLPKSHPRFKWTPPGEEEDTPPAAPPAQPDASEPYEGTAPPHPHEADYAGAEEGPMTAEQGEEALLNDRTGTVSINQMLGNRKFATKDDLWNASDRMRGKLGPAGAAKWAADYGKAEFETLARQIVNSLLEDDIEKEVKDFEKKSKSVAKKTEKTVAGWMRGLGRKRPVK